MLKNPTLLLRILGLIALTSLFGCQQESGPAATSSSGDTSSDSNQQYLQAHATEAGVISLPSGLQYKVITKGSGASPGPTDSVTVHYRGTLLDGTEFDSSYKRGEPASFPVNRVIAGWTEALQLMHEGDKWELTIPPRLGYGSRGAGGSIPGDSVLIFEVELIKAK